MTLSRRLRRAISFIALPAVHTHSQSLLSNIRTATPGTVHLGNDVTNSGRFFAPLLTSSGKAPGGMQRPMSQVILGLMKLVTEIHYHIASKDFQWNWCHENGVQLKPNRNQAEGQSTLLAWHLLRILKEGKQLIRHCTLILVYRLFQAFTSSIHTVSVSFSNPNHTYA